MNLKPKTGRSVNRVHCAMSQTAESSNSR